MYEALFRLSLVRMALEQSSPIARRLRRTTASRTLDPSEKGAVNYFLGLTVCKLFAWKLLQCPWLMHLDVFRPLLNPVLIGRSRPDLVGEIRGARGWIAIECKGRATAPSEDAKAKAKEQALRLVSVNSSAPVLHVGAFVFFRSNALQFYWRDPSHDESVKQPINVRIEDTIWRHYYLPVLELVRSRPDHRAQILQGQPIAIEELDIQVGIRTEVMPFLDAEQWNEARAVGERSARGPDEQGYQIDGIRIVAGTTWFRPLEDEV